MLLILGYNLEEEYQKNRFSLFDHQQIQCIVDYLEYKLEQNYTDTEHKRTIQKWKQKLN